jgi:hypothetical protein
MDQFFEAASAAALRALDAHARETVQGPDPLPWQVNPQIWVGIIASFQGGLNRGKLEGGGGGGGFGG